jgi:hypothetical protein
MVDGEEAPFARDAFELVQAVCRYRHVQDAQGSAIICFQLNVHAITLPSCFWPLAQF